MKYEMHSPTRAKNSKTHDDQTPVKDGNAGSSINLLNFGNLINAKGAAASTKAPVTSLDVDDNHDMNLHRPQVRGSFQGKDGFQQPPSAQRKESILSPQQRTANFNDTQNNIEDPNHFNMYRGSIHQALPAEPHQHEQQTSGPFLGKPIAQLIVQQHQEDPE